MVCMAKKCGLLCQTTVRLEGAFKGHQVWLPGHFRANQKLKPTVRFRNRVQTYRGIRGHLLLRCCTAAVSGLAFRGAWGLLLPCFWAWNLPLAVWRREKIGAQQACRRTTCLVGAARLAYCRIRQPGRHSAQSITPAGLDKYITGSVISSFYAVLCVCFHRNQLCINWGAHTCGLL